LSFSIIGQVHLVTENSHAKTQHQYCDIVITGPGAQAIILELVATARADKVEEHTTRVSSYKDILGVNDAWVIHFTCEDDYFNHPTWQTEEQLADGINVVHIWHDLEYSRISMAAHWKDAEGKIQHIDNQPVVV
jgi:hypothetical protein